MRGWGVALIVTAVSVAVGSTAWAQAPAPAANSTTARIGVVDLSRVMARSAAGVAAREQLERERASMQREFDTKRQELEKLREELEKKGPLMTVDARREKQDTLERKQRDLARLAEDFQKELEKKEQILSQKMLQELRGIIDRVGKQRGYAVIVEKRAGVLYMASDADVTDEIIRAYDQEAGSKGKK